MIGWKGTCSERALSHDETNTLQVVGRKAPTFLKKAAAALSVGVGHYSDPEKLPGLSHYLEHMLFMGSEPFPDENEYDAYLTTHGGSSNACTEEESTTYHFDVHPAHLKGALERFAGFFTAPLIKKDSLEREVLAVDSEFNGVLQSDSCRLYQLRCSTCRSKHPASKFGWGNKKTLADIPDKNGWDMRQELLNHYEESYTSERMNVVILAGQSLDELEVWSKEFFSAVPSRMSQQHEGVGPQRSLAACGLPLAKGGEIYILPAVRREHKVRATFQFPSLHYAYLKKPDEYLSHLIGHEGKGSLLSALKSRGWATDLCAGTSENTSAFAFFEVTITLTQSGLDAAPGMGLACIKVLFEYLSMLKNSGPQEWVFNEIAAINAMRFKFWEETDAADTVADLAGSIHNYPLADVVAEPYLYKEWDPRLLSQLLQSMSPEGVRLDLLTADYDTLKEGARLSSCQECKEPWFEFPYIRMDLPEALLAEWSDGCRTDHLSFPPRNEFLPSEFGLRSCDEGEIDAVPPPHDYLPPIQLIDRPGVRLWHKLDTTFKLPRALLFLRLASLDSYDSPRSAALTHLAVKLLEDALCEIAYLADVAGLRYSLSLEGRHGIDIKVEGFNHRLPKLAAFLFETLTTLGQKKDDDKSSKAFERVKEALVRQYANSNLKPLKHATWLRLRTLRHGMWGVDAVQKEVQAAEYKDVIDHLTFTLLNPVKVHAEALVMGNVTAGDADALLRDITALLGHPHLPADERVRDAGVILPSGSQLLHRTPSKNPEEENSAVEAYLQCGPDSLLPRVVGDLVDQIVFEPCYDTLRTKEQLGYTVHSGSRLTGGLLGFCIIVQSDNRGPVYVHQRIDAFLTAFWERLKNMPHEEFEKHRDALVQLKLQKEKTLLEEGERAWEAITSRKYTFSSRKEEAAALIERVTKEHVLAFYRENFLPQSTSRRSLSIHIIGKQHMSEDASALTQNYTVFESIDELRAALPKYVAPVGQIPMAAHSEAEKTDANGKRQRTL